MGEHKLRLEKDTNGDEPAKLSTHIVTVVDVVMPCPNLDALMEGGYQTLAERAKAEDSFILNAVQAENVYQVWDQERNLIAPHLVVTITAQRISRAELEQQQIRQRMGIK